MKKNLLNKVCSMAVLASMLSAPISVAFAEGAGPGNNNSGDHGSAPSGASGNHGGTPSAPPAAPSKPTTPSASPAAPSKPTTPSAPSAPSKPTPPAQPVANNPPPQQNPRPNGGDNNNNNNNTGNEIAAGIGGAIVIGELLGSLFGNKAVSWNWVESTDDNGNNTLVCYGFNKKGQQVGKPLDDSKCASVEQPVNYQMVQNSDGSESCYEYYNANNDTLNGGQPMDDSTLCGIDPSAATQ